VDESDEEEDDELTKDGKAMKKLIRNLEKNTAYDSDEERNPYASSVSLLI
jgi:transcription initiation factor TFIIF subunit alpha